MQERGSCHKGRHHKVLGMHQSCTTAVRVVFQGALALHLSITCCSKLGLQKSLGAHVVSDLLR